MLSKKTKYGLKALIYLSKQEWGVPVLISEIATSQNVSKKFLETILLEIKKTGVLGSKMGKNGGYFLRKKPEEISIAFVYRILEGPISWVPCVSLNYYQKCEDCEDEVQCELKKMMIEIRNNTLQILENKTLIDFN